MATSLRAATTSRTSTSNPWLRLVHRLEETAALDRVVDPATALFRGVVGEEGTLRDLVDGRATHVPPHVVLTDVPLGAWFMAQYLDLFDDEASRVAARRLVALGLAGAAPTALTGWLRWAWTDRATRRVGVVHAGANALSIAIYAGSLAARTTGHHRAGVRLARLGGVALVAGGFLGGHLGRAARDLPRE